MWWNIWAENTCKQQIWRLKTQKGERLKLKEEHANRRYTEKRTDKEINENTKSNNGRFTVIPSNAVLTNH